jgi:SAM-dependent methyltransferase
VISDDASEQWARRELSRRGFADGADYQAALPGYPPAALEYLVRSLGLGERDRVVDLGAGTGLLSHELRARFADVIAIEPSAGMREVLVAAVAGVHVLDGRDVAIPLPDACVEAVFVAQAFHWFDAPRALEEIHRVLVPGGGLALLWNNRDESVGWVAEFSRAMRWDRCSPYSAATDYVPVLAAGPFARIARHGFRHVQLVDRQQLYRRVLSTSYVAIMGARERAALLADVREVVEQLDEPIAFPYVTEVYRASALPTAPAPA